MTKEKPNELKQTEKSLMELQLAEQGLQGILMQKQTFQLELVEVENALLEVKKMKNGEVFKIIGALMFKADEKEIVPEFEKKRDILNIRMKAIEKQEQDLKSKLIEAREELIKKLKS